MHYIKVDWIHGIAHEPTELYSELDANRREIRKVEVLREGTASYASSEASAGSSRLSELPIPTLQEIAHDPQFLPKEITAEEFESIWRRALASPKQIASNQETARNQ
jgi:hypothetical protein